jgi:hypothetical protein
MVVITAPDKVRDITSRDAACGIDAWECGNIIPGTGRVRLDGVVT